MLDEVYEGYSTKFYIYIVISIKVVFYTMNIYIETFDRDAEMKLFVESLVNHVETICSFIVIDGIIDLTQQDVLGSSVVQVYYYLH